MRALGYNVWLYRYLAMLIAGAVAGVAGVLFAWYNQFVGPAISISRFRRSSDHRHPRRHRIALRSNSRRRIVVFLSNGLSALTQRWELILGAIYFIIVMYAPDGLMGVGHRIVRRIQGNARTAADRESAM